MLDLKKDVQKESKSQIFQKYLKVLQWNKMEKMFPWMPFRTSCRPIIQHFEGYFQTFAEDL